MKQQQSQIFCRPDELDVKIGNMARPRDPIGRIYKVKTFYLNAKRGGLNLGKHREPRDQRLLM